MIRINEIEAVSAKTKPKKPFRSFLEELNKPVITLSPAGAQRPTIEVVRFAAGGVACIIARSRLTKQQISHTLDLIPGGKLDAKLPRKWTAWAVWVDRSWVAPDHRPRPSFTIQFGC